MIQSCASLWWPYNFQFPLHFFLRMDFFSIQRWCEKIFSYERSGNPPPQLYSNATTNPWQLSLSQRGMSLLLFSTFSSTCPKTVLSLLPFCFLFFCLLSILSVTHYIYLCFLPLLFVCQWSCDNLCWLCEMFDDLRLTCCQCQVTTSNLGVFP